MKHQIRTAALALLIVTGTATANDSPDHFDGIPSNSLPQALEHLEAYNTQLASLLAQPMDVATMAEIHQLTYTLENALERMQEALEQLSETLESVHKDSEYAAADTLPGHAHQYLEDARPWTE
ncbi:DUF6746 family protein [Marinobacter zhejiangensis]|uniref:Uncharacterized protein n=1 Tax=Marinobacter zhejiangensis TaxID=488535 RepID=A0A1I4LUI1_9GAMM|nr:DUF6746 family protein [Marinobacter zhejiangensis]SFL94493.1 hypothetical protein SAMN04487963_0663 [Marinobacter zhejiangensis]